MDDEQKQQQQNNAYSLSVYSQQQQQLQRQYAQQLQQNGNNMQSSLNNNRSGAQSHQQSNGYPSQPQYGYRLIEGVEVASHQQSASSTNSSHVLKYTSPDNGSRRPSPYQQQQLQQQPTSQYGFAAQSPQVQVQSQYGGGAYYNTSPYQQSQQHMRSSPAGYTNSTAQSSRGRSNAYQVNNLHAANNQQQQQQLITPQTSMTPHEFYRSASQGGSVSVSGNYHPSIASSAQQPQLNIGNNAPPGLVQQNVPPGLDKQSVPSGLLKMNAPPGLTKQQGDVFQDVGENAFQDVRETALGKAEAAEAAAQQSQQTTKSYQISDTGRLNQLSTAATELTSPKSSNNQISTTQAVAELSSQTASVAAQLLQQEIINRQNQQTQPRHLSSQAAVVQQQVKVCSMCGNSKKKHSYCVAEWSKAEGDGVCNVCIKAEGLDVLKSSASKKSASSDATANLPNGVSPTKEKNDDSSSQKVSPQFVNSRGSSSSKPNPSTNSSVNTSPNSSKSTRACGNCEACKRPDCGTCTNCLDKPKFGGEHKKKQKCIMRRCPHHENKSKRPSGMSGDNDDIDEAMEDLKERVRTSTSPKTATSPVSSASATTTATKKPEVKTSESKPAAKPIDNISMAYLRSLLTKKKSKPTTLSKTTPAQQQQMDICIPATFSPKHSYRASAAYSLLRTLSNELRLGPFTLDAFTNALMLPLPSKLLGDIHVRLLRVLFANGGLGRNYGEYARFGDGGVEHIVRKKRTKGCMTSAKKSDNTNADIGTEVVGQEETELIPMQGGNNLSFLDSTTWPLFYQDYANATKDKFHDVMEEGILSEEQEDDEKVVNNEEFIDVKSEAMQPLVDIDLNPKFILNTTKVEPEWIDQCPFGPLGKRNASGLFLCCPFHIHAAIRGYQKVSSAQQGITFSEDKKRKMIELPEKRNRRGRGRSRKSDESSGSDFSAEDLDSDDDDYPSSGKKRPRRASSNGGRKRGRPKKVQTSQSGGGAEQQKRVVLTATEGKALLHATPEAKVALRDAILSGIRHPQGKIDPVLLKLANSHGLSRKVIMNAAAVARQKALDSAGKALDSAESNNKLSFSEQRSQFLGSKVPYFKAAPTDNSKALKAAHDAALSSQKEKTEMERRIALAREKAGYTLPNETVPNPLAASNDTETSASSLDVSDSLAKNIRGGGTTGEVVDLTENEDITKPAASQQPRSRLVPNATLPQGWSQHVDNKTGKTFYYNKEHKKSTWVKPTIKGGSQGTYPPINLNKIPVYGSAHKNAIVVSDRVAQSLEQFLLNGPSSTPSSNIPSTLKSKDESDQPNDDAESGTPASSADHLLSHMEPVSQLSKGIPYHALSISSKLSMIEFLLDELLQVPEFSYIFRHREAATRVFNSRYGTAPQPKDYEEMINQDECTICGLEGDLLCCDGCPSSVHRACIGMSPYTKLPDGKWFCPECQIVDVSKMGPLGSERRPFMGWFTLDDVELQPEQQPSAEQGGNESEPPPFAQQALPGYVGMPPPYPQSSPIANPMMTSQQQHHKKNPQVIHQLGQDMQDEQENDKIKVKTDVPDDVEFLVTAGKVFARYRTTLEPFDPLDIDKQPPEAKQVFSVPQPPIPLTASQIKQLLHLLGPTYCLALPWRRLPYNAEKLITNQPVASDNNEEKTDKHNNWSIQDESLRLLVAYQKESKELLQTNTPEHINPTVYMNDYRRAPHVPMIQDHIGTFVFSAPAVPDVNVYPTRISAPLSLHINDVTKERNYNVRIPPFDPMKPIRDKMIKLERSLNGGCLLIAKWDINSKGNVKDGNSSWRGKVQSATSIKRLSSLLIELVDATSLRVFISNWYSKHGRDSTHGDSMITVSGDDWSFERESVRRKWENAEDSDLLRMFNGDLEGVFRRAGPENKRGKLIKSSEDGIIAEDGEVTNSDAPKKPMHAYNHFFRSKSKEIKDTHSASDIFKVASRLWKSMSQSEKAVWNDKAAADKVRYEKEMEIYMKKQGSTPVKDDSTDTLAAQSSSTTPIKPEDAIKDSSQKNGGKPFPVGTAVNVERRVLPGSNKYGGVGRIVKVHSSSNQDGTTTTKYDVKYVLEKLTEKDVEECYVTEYKELDNEVDVSPGKKEVETKCNCAACSQLDCKSCANCLDKVEYGGPGLLQQQCVFKDPCLRIEGIDSPAKAEASLAVETPAPKTPSETKTPASKSKSSTKKKRQRSKRDTSVPSKKRRSERLNEIRQQLEILLGISEDMETDEIERAIVELKLDKLQKLCQSNDKTPRGFWPVAGRMLFEPNGTLPRPVIKKLGRNAGSARAPCITYDSQYEVGETKVCHHWRKRTLACTSYEGLLHSLKVLEAHMDTQLAMQANTIATRRSNAYSNTHGKTAVRYVHTDPATGFTEYFILQHGRKRGCWMTEEQVDLTSLVQYRYEQKRPYLPKREQASPATASSSSSYQSMNRSMGSGLGASANLFLQKQIEFNAAITLHSQAVCNLLVASAAKGDSSVDTDAISQCRNKTLTAMRRSNFQCLPESELMKRVGEAEHTATQLYIQQKQMTRGLSGM